LHATMRVAMCVNRTANRRILAVILYSFDQREDSGPEPLGGSLPKESGYEWDVISSGSGASVDDLAVLSGRAQRFPSQTDSNLGTFTTQ
jgi:hypothetical protein